MGSDDTVTNSADRRAPASPLVRRVQHRVDTVFENLGACGFIKPSDHADFLFYRRAFEESLLGIDARLFAGTLNPVTLGGFPLEGARKREKITAALFIGSFDPFQMTHIAMALRYLGTPRAKASVVFVIPEGHRNSAKPLKSDYDYRLSLASMQLKTIFEPFVTTLDLGRDADTIEVVNRFIALFPGARVEMIHLLGSDVLPIAARLLPEDLAIWRRCADKHGVDFSYEAFVARRERFEDVEPGLEAMRACGVEAILDDRTIRTPSSTDFRVNSAFTILFPTEELLRRMEILFRYNLSRPWMDGAADGSEGGEGHPS